MSVVPLGTLYRTHTCGELRASDIGTDVVLLGWVHRARDLGALVFFDVRDRYGLTQVVAGVGRVEHRAPDATNPRLPTGEIEVVAREIRVLSEARTPPFQISEEASANEDLRLRY